VSFTVIVISEYCASTISPNRGKPFEMFARMLVLFTTLTLLLMVFGLILGYYFGDPLAYMLLGLLFAAVINFASYAWSDRFVLWSTHTKLIKEQDNPQLYSIVRSVAQRANIPMPRVGIVDSPQPNAFATGRGPDKAVVVATTGILKTLTPGELEAVFGHEISHVTHRDVLVASVAATIAGAISFIGQMILWNTFFFGSGGRSRGNNNGNGALILMIVAAILIPIGAMLVQLGISRSRESYADEEGARLTQKPQELINALRKISNRATAAQWNQKNAPSPATASLWLVNPLKGSSWTEIFSTHPSLQKRIQNISKVAKEMGIMVS
jgi:heat shock protein HtpX